MKKRPLGYSGLEIAPLALGGNVFGWTADENASLKILDAFVAGGFNLVDTADYYSVWQPGHKGGESETVIGTWLKRSGVREKVVLATKVGLEIAPDKKGLSKKYILRSAEDSLRRLQTDYIDLYQSHTDDTTTPLQETLEAYAQLIKDGKVRAIGASNYSATRLDEALRISAQMQLPTYQSLQPEYNLYDRAGYEADLEQLCLKKGVGVICYFGLARGFLTGKYRTTADLRKSVRGDGIKKYLNDRGFRILAALDQTAKEHGATPAQIALAWLMARPSIAAPIASATSVQQLEELMKAAAITLSKEDLARLDTASASSKPPLSM